MTLKFEGKNNIFPRKDTNLRKKAFLCRYESPKITPININSGSPRPARLREIPREPQQAIVDVSHYDIPTIHTLLRPIDRALSFFEQPLRLGLHHSRH